MALSSTIAPQKMALEDQHSRTTFNFINWGFSPRLRGTLCCSSQLYRSSSFNSSGCGSGGEPADDMYSDVSLEEDVQGLNYKVSGSLVSDNESSVI